MSESVKSRRTPISVLLIAARPMVLLSLILINGGCPPNTELAGLESPLPILAVEPARGPTIGGTPVSIFGKDFDRGARVLFGGFLSPQVDMMSAEEIRAVVPSQASGFTDVTVILPGKDAFVAPSAYEYVAIAEADAQIISLVERRFPGAPRLVSAISLGNTRIRLTFSEPVAGQPRNDDVPNMTVMSSATGALDPANYQIIIPDGGNLALDDGRDLEDPTQAPKILFSDDQTVVEITTLSQSDADYVLTASGITDLSGKPLSPPDILVSPAQASFRGIPPVAFDSDPNAIHIDRDGDGFADWFEMLGWDITIELANGVITQAHVTSDPYSADTDCDGLSDSEENARSLDPRTDDTDADRVTDCDETRVWLSDPADQDTDNDGLSDETEVHLNTSLVLADTDGDQLSDREEIVLRNRNPRLADLPLPQIRIGEMSLEIDERFSYTDEEGFEQTIESSSSQSFLQSDTTTLAESNTTSTTASQVFSGQIEGGYGDGSATGGWHFQVTAGYENSRQRGYSSTISEESSQTAQREYSESLAQALSMSERREVTRSVEGARLSVDLTVANAGDVSFSLSNLEITARVQDARNRDRFLPLASLTSASGNETINLGAIQSQRGPFIFENAEIFPNLAQSLLRDPRTIIFDIANYDIVDEFGRNFAFTSEEINDLTAGILFDFGDGRVEQYRVATASRFIPLNDAVDQLSGCDECPAEGPRVAEGITMLQALQEIGLDHSEVEDANLTAAELAAARDSFGTTTSLIDHDNDSDTQGLPVELLTRIRDVQTDVENTPRDKRFWVVMTPTGEVDRSVDFTDIRLHPRDDYQLWYTQDLDEDGLYARQEFLAGSSDNSVDTDNDGLSDVDEIKNGWAVQILGQSPYRAYPNPARPDTDFDLVDDIVERRYGTDPRLQDSDSDGLEEFKELMGFEFERISLDEDGSEPEFITVYPYSNAAIVEPCTGGDNTVSTAKASGSDDVQIVAVGETVSAGTPIIGPGPDGVIDTTPDGDEIIGSFGPTIIATQGGVAATMAHADDVQVIDVDDDVSAGDVVVRAGCDGVIQTMASGTETKRANHRDYFATDPLLLDTDFDGLADGREELLGSDPNNPNDSALDSDGDGLLDVEETNGWTVEFVDSTGDCNDCTTSIFVTSDPFQPDTDNDGLPDALESALRTNPRQRDSDGDTISDRDEFLPGFREAAYFGDDIADRLAAFEARCNVSPACSFTPAAEPIGSSPLDIDSDNDRVRDNAELDGWLIDLVGDNNPPFLVTSDPTIADTDNDGLTDRDERIGADGFGPNNDNDTFDATNPRLPDTDNDDVNDIVELNQNDSGNIDHGKRNPLKRDQLLRVDYDRFQVVSRCDGGGATDEGEFQFRLSLVTPNGQRRDLVDTGRNSDRQDLTDQCPSGGGGNECRVQLGGPCNSWVIRMRDDSEITIPNSYRRTFVIGFDEVAELKVRIEELDGCDNDFTTNKTRTINGLLNSSIDDRFRHNPGANCDVRVDYKVDIITN